MDLLCTPEKIILELKGLHRVEFIVFMMNRHIWEFTKVTPLTVPQNKSDNCFPCSPGFSDDCISVVNIQFSSYPIFGGQVNCSIKIQQRPHYNKNYKIKKKLSICWRALILPRYWIHEEKIVVWGAWVLAVVHVFFLGGVLDVFDHQFHLFT